MTDDNAKVSELDEPPPIELFVEPTNVLLDPPTMAPEFPEIELFEPLPTKLFAVPIIFAVPAPINDSWAESFPEEMMLREPAATTESSSHARFL
jgi:hypothetical protein